MRRREDEKKNKQQEKAKWDEEQRKVFGNRLKEVMEAKNIKIGDLAAKLSALLGEHVDYRRVQSWITGERSPRLADARAVSDILGVDMEFLTKPIVPEDKEKLIAALEKVVKELARWPKQSDTLELKRLSDQISILGTTPIKTPATYVTKLKPIKQLSAAGGYTSDFTEETVLVPLPPELLPPAANYEDIAMVNVVGDSMVGAGIHNGDKVLIRSDIAPKPGDMVVATIGEEGLPTVKYYVEKDGKPFLRAANPNYEDYELQENDSIKGVVYCVISTHVPPPPKNL